MTVSQVTILFTKSHSRRRRRSTSTDTTITCVLSGAVSELTDISALSNTVSNSVKTGAGEAIANSAGTYISTDAVATVTSTVLDSNASTANPGMCYHNRQ